MLDSVKTYLLKLQNDICQAVLTVDPQGDFKEDQWQRPNGGGGITRIFQQGEVFEAAGVNFSHVSGDSLPPASTMHRKDLSQCAFHALGVSTVMHPHNPYVPTTHANVRFFLATPPQGAPIWWFGGGFDLTPYYGFLEDCQHWHATAKRACDPFGSSLYAQFKTNCDQYFYLPHRQEARGIGGLFFDDYKEKSFEHSFGLMQSIGNHFIEAYFPIVKKRFQTPFKPQHTSFQRYRRGRYVEFNLIYDRGTLFGLQSQGRTESILMSLPPQVEWRYDWQPLEGSEERQLYEEFLPVREWVY